MQYLSSRFCLAAAVICSSTSSFLAGIAIRSEVESGSLIAAGAALAVTLAAVRAVYIVLGRA